MSWFCKFNRSLRLGFQLPLVRIWFIYVENVEGCCSFPWKKVGDDWKRLLSMPPPLPSHFDHKWFAKRSISESWLQRGVGHKLHGTKENEILRKRLLESIFERLTITEISVNFIRLGYFGGRPIILVISSPVPSMVGIVEYNDFGRPEIQCFWSEMTFINT